MSRIHFADKKIVRLNHSKVHNRRTGIFVWGSYSENEFYLGAWYWLDYVAKCNVTVFWLNEETLGLPFLAIGLSKSAGFQQVKSDRFQQVKSVWNPADFRWNPHEILRISWMWAFAWWSSIGLSFERPNTW